MEEVTTWKNHTFTLLIFGGIIVLCSIFFALGMVVGRTQGRHIAEVAFKETATKKVIPDDGSDNFKLNIYEETTGDNPIPSLQPPPAVREETPPAAEQPPSKNEKPGSPKPVSPTVVAPPAGGELLQIYASKDANKAQQELTRVTSKGFKARILIRSKDNVKLHRVVVGPYKESEINLAKKDLQAKGYKDVFVAK